MPESTDKLAACMLLSLPAELRNTIYEYALVPHAPATAWYERVDLLDARPPPKALLLTCKQVCEEATSMYKSAYRKFWSATPFSLGLNEHYKYYDLDTSILTREQIIANREAKEEMLAAFMRRISDEDVAHIHSLAMRDHLDESHTVLINGVWQGGRGGTHWTVVFVPRSKVGAVEAAGWAVDEGGINGNYYTTCCEVMIGGISETRMATLRNMTGRNVLTKGKILAAYESLLTWDRDRRGLIEALAPWAWERDPGPASDRRG